MCGIAGVLYPDADAAPSARLAVDKMVARMRNRGPDATGTWEAPGVVLGHRRLAIIDLDPRANQPMISQDGRYAISFNGEIYNYPQLRSELVARGAELRTTSDTEVLLQLYALEGEAMLNRLRGMFAFAIWDRLEHVVFLARDPYGIKPLYYSSVSGCFIFASQVSAIIDSGVVGRQREPAGLVGFCLWGSVPEPWTFYRNVFALPAGHYLKCSASRWEDAAPTSWVDVRGCWSDAQAISRDELRELVFESVRDSVQSHLVSDVPVSVFLSGGIDSTAVASIASKFTTAVEAVTIGFAEFDSTANDEVPAARAFARHLGMRHHVHTVTRREFDEDLQKIIVAMDQPSIDGVNTWFASKAAAAAGFKVVLSGIGGDELFCGYSLFRSIPRERALGVCCSAIPGISSIAKLAFAAVEQATGQPKWRSVPEYWDSIEGLYFLHRTLFMPGDLPVLIGADIAHEGLKRLAGGPPGITKQASSNSTQALAGLESTMYLRNQLLRDSDWASMAHSLELRTPLVDLELARSLGKYASYFAHGTGKKLLSQAAGEAMPPEVTERVKTGFSIPMGTWLPSQTLDESLPSPSFLGPWPRRWASAILEMTS